MANTDNFTGKAYGFFYCGASKQEIEAKLPAIRKLVNTPSQLELTLIEGMDNVRGDEKLTTLAQEAKQDGINYLLQATYPNGTNRQAANEVADILNQAYQSPLYKTNAEFCGSVVYDEKGDYVFRE
ncbi:hypothetical protein J4438_02150 [Candidatus Woesearchaeota archaeon]|nr:hypothetical protein [Candidatus Woesearchaeota archaeon]